MNPRRYTYEELGRMVSMIEKQMTMAEIAEELGRTERSVVNKIQRIRAFMKPVVRKEVIKEEVIVSPWWKFWA